VTAPPKSRSSTTRLLNTPCNFHVHCGESKAKPFKWTAERDDVLTGELQIENAFTANATRRWISFELNPIS